MGQETQVSKSQSKIFKVEYTINTLSIKTNEEYSKVKNFHGKKIKKLWVLLRIRDKHLIKLSRTELF